MVHVPQREVVAATSPEVVAPGHAVATPVPPSRPGGLASAPELPQTRAYEAAALTTLSAVLQAMDSRGAGTPTVPDIGQPAVADRAAALAELDAAVAAGRITPEEMGVRRARLLALAEAGPRLRALLELRDGGNLSPADLTRKRAAVLAPLSRQVFGDE